MIDGKIRNSKTDYFLFWREMVQFVSIVKGDLKRDFSQNNHNILFSIRRQRSKGHTGGNIFNMRSKKRNSNGYRFQVTSNQSYGMSINKIKKELDTLTQEQNEEELSHVPENNCPDLSFVYTRESDSFGLGISNSDSLLAKAMAENISVSEKLKNQRERKLNKLMMFQDYEKPKSNSLTNDQVTQVLESYQHHPKKQHPLYTTTSNQIGFKKPTEATFTATRIARKQGFSNSFHSIMFKDEGLNTYKSRSKVHSLLDQHFV